MPGAAVWERDGADWPNRAASRFVVAGGMRWHVQRMGQGPTLLLLHGTGAGTHSWRDLMPLLAENFDVIAADLPGHAFSATPAGDGLSLPGMARGVAALLRALDADPVLAVGHSAGAAVAIRMTLDGLIAPAHLVALNGALLPLGGVAGSLFSPLAKLLVGLPAIPWLVSLRAESDASVERLLRGTGSTLDRRGLDLYARLFRRRGHVAATLGMMARWDLAGFARDLPRLRTPLTLIVGGNDRTVPPSEARRIRALLPGAALVTLPGLGHLAHEEAPEAVAEHLCALLRMSVPEHAL